MRKVIAILVLFIVVFFDAHAGEHITNIGGCTPISKNNPKRQLIESDVANFVRKVPESASVRFEVQNCKDDGIALEGGVIVISSRISRLTPPLRFFIIGHEYGHLALSHKGKTDARTGQPLLKSMGAKSMEEFTELAQRDEFEADAFAIRRMYINGMNGEEVALGLESFGGENTTTHPSSARRAQAIRGVLLSFSHQ